MPQNTLIAHLESPDFSCSALYIARVRGREAISQLFSFVIEVVCTEPDDFHFDQILGKKASLHFEQDDAEVRVVHGIIAEIAEIFTTGQGTQSTAFRLVLAPRAHRLAQVEMQEVFLDLPVLDKSKADIVGQKLGRASVTGPDVDVRLATALDVRQFVVQYRETDLAFVSRLTENLGISFYFTHDAGFDKIVFTDNPAGFQTIEGHDTATIRARGETGGVFDLEYCTKAMPKTWTLQDYNHRAPLLNVIGTYLAPAGLSGKVVEFGPHIHTPLEGRTLAQIRADERTALEMINVVRGVSHTVRLVTAQGGLRRGLDADRA